MNEIYTTDEVALILRVHKQTVLNLVKKGLLKAFKAGYQWRYLKKDIDLYIENNTIRQFNFEKKIDIKKN